MKEHTQSLGKLKASLNSIFHLSCTHLAEPFFHERAGDWISQASFHPMNTPLPTSVENTWHVTKPSCQH